MYNTHVEQNSGETVLHDENYFKDYLIKAGCNFLTTTKPIDKTTFDSQKLKKIFGDNSETVETILAPIILNYLQKSIITDAFQDHHDRREWRRNLPTDVRKYYEDKNKIRGNSITCILGAISLLSEITEDVEFKEQFDKEYKDLVVDPKDPRKRFEYNDLNIDQKIEFVGKLDSTASRILELIS